MPIHIKFSFNLLLFLGLSLLLFPAMAQKPVQVGDEVQEHIFTFSEIEYLEDPAGALTFEQVQAKSNSFHVLNKWCPVINNQSAYWYRIKVNYEDQLKDNYIIEFFDQTIDDITAYIPDGEGKYNVYRTGAKHEFGSRLFSHKNFEFALQDFEGKEQVYYFRVTVSQRANVIIVLRSVSWFIHYALDEYFTFGIFYGMILIFCFYNFLMLLVMKQRQYVFYILYILSIGFYEMSTDGIAFQYLWPESPWLNRNAYGIALYFMSTFALLFARDLLHVKSKAPKLDKVLLAVIGLRTLYFLFCIIVKPEWFEYRFVEIIPLSISFATGIYIFKHGYRAARFFLLGYSFVYLGFLVKVLIIFGYGDIFGSPAGHYILAICFVMEMVLLSFAIGDKVRLLKKKKENAQKRIIKQMDVNLKLKDTLNKELENQVQSRTKEVVEKSREILLKSQVIEQKNDELLAMNVLLKQQAEEISRMNALLKEDNVELQSNIQKVTQARALSTEVDFEEFSKIYPDNDSCFKFLADLKWENGYSCWKCGHKHFFHGRYPYSRRCAACSYDESVTANTIFQGTRIQINKAFYMVYLIYTTQGKISSHKLSEILSIRQGTCWTYSSKVKKVMEERKKDLHNAGEKGWSKLVLETNQFA
ncbi:7TM diverse intracellular signaling domain-containing protein [Pontibacter sp. SGAir0037]|uniref:7TM diverse intracellular signaling domain-containing protein n=1 Tax=Pontibacter sp. SGAir0037 TaxID=2571030 RepID=UPI0010CD1686|nr:7TM diverse intracellular signaling domain-containing protein [Pontibacter sp. SGAir0037]QCR23257.1 chromosome partitioning protein ParA [Pontibacter sp. SGAir0037]